MERHYLGIEIGGTKLQLGVGPDDGRLRALVREEVNPTEGADGIRRQIEAAVPALLQRAALSSSDLHGVGIGFGGPVDDTTRTVLTSHQIAGWDGFPLADWIADVVGLPAVLGNDADVAGLAEATHGAGKGLSPLFYITLGSGIGGGFIVDGEIYRGVGRGAAEIGQVRIETDEGIWTLEQLASGWGIEERYYKRWDLASPTRLAVPEIVHRAEAGERGAREVLAMAIASLSLACTHVIALLCPRRIVLGGGVSLMGERLFGPLRTLVERDCFRPFAGLTDIVPAALGEEVVVHGAIRLARQRLA